MCFLRLLHFMITFIILFGVSPNLELLIFHYRRVQPQNPNEFDDREAKKRPEMKKHSLKPKTTQITPNFRRIRKTDLISVSTR